MAMVAYDEQAAAYWLGLKRLVQLHDDDGEG